MKIGQCSRCGRTTIDVRTYLARPDLRNGHKQYGARGLCKSCYTTECRYGCITDWPRRNRSREELLGEWAWLSAAGIRLEEAAERLGVSWMALDRALHRAVADGDERGRHTGCWKLDKIRA